MPRNYTVGLVYFVHSPDHRLIKIGVTKEHPDHRFRGLVAGSPAPLAKLGILQGGWEREQNLHARFVHLRAFNEWFREADDLWAYVRRYVKPWPSGDVFPDPKTGDEFRAEQEAFRRYRQDVERTLTQGRFNYWLDRVDEIMPVGLA